MHGRVGGSSRVKPPDGIGAIRAVNFISLSLNVYTILWLFVVSVQASSQGEIFWNCFVIQKY